MQPFERVRRSAAERTPMTRPMSEQAVLRLSIAMTFVVAAVGIGFGVASGSASIIFDGIYSLTDAVMTSVALLVSSLITQRLSVRRQARLVQRFSQGASIRKCRPVSAQPAARR